MCNFFKVEGFYLMSILSRLFRWQGGRQNTGYEKMLLCSTRWPVKFDLYILKFNLGSEIFPHIDSVAFGKHYRLNIVLWAASEGGEFICSNPIFATKKIKFFRPDISEHSVTKIRKGTRYVLSLGWIRAA